MTLSKDGEDPGAIDRLERWLASNPDIPRFRHRANKAAICRHVGIARSTADANPKIRALIAGLDRKVLAAQLAAPMAAPVPKSTVLEESTLPCPARGRPTDSNCHSPALEHLLKTGRVVR